MNQTINRVKRSSNKLLKCGISFSLSLSTLVQTSRPIWASSAAVSFFPYFSHPCVLFVVFFLPSNNLFFFFALLLLSSLFVGSIIVLCLFLSVSLSLSLSRIFCVLYVTTGSLCYELQTNACFCLRFGERQVGFQNQNKPAVSAEKWVCPDAWRCLVKMNLQQY